MRRKINYSHVKPAEQKPKEITEKDVWIGVACAVAGAINCKESDVAIGWANKCADAFAKRYGGKK